MIVYVSNASEADAVFFDNLQVTHERGRILEENTYYPEGLKIAGLCAKAAGKLPNEFGYQGNYSEEEEESGYDEFALRTYDPTIARWLSTDPYDQFASPYISMGNDPVNNVDPDGGFAMVVAVEKMLSVWNHVVPQVGQFSGVAQGTSLSTASSSAAGGSGGSSLGGGMLNAAGNMIAGLAGQWVANKLFPLPSGPDAGQLQQPVQQAAPGTMVTKTTQPQIAPTTRYVDVGGISDPSNADLPDILKYATAQIQVPIVQQFLRLLFGGAAGGAGLLPPSTDWITPMTRDLRKQTLQWTVKLILIPLAKLLTEAPLPAYPTDPTKPPAPGYEWRGKGIPGSSEGAWYNPGTKESLHPDLDHPVGIDPHWDYTDPYKKQYRWFPNGTITPK